MLSSGIRCGCEIVVSGALLRELQAKTFELLTDAETGMLETQRRRTARA